MSKIPGLLQEIPDSEWLPGEPVKPTRTIRKGDKSTYHPGLDRFPDYEIRTYEFGFHYPKPVFLQHIAEEFSQASFGYNRPGGVTIIRAFDETGRLLSPAEFKASGVRVHRPTDQQTPKRLSRLLRDYDVWNEYGTGEDRSRLPTGSPHLSPNAQRPEVGFMPTGSTEEMDAMGIISRSELDRQLAGYPEEVRQRFGGRVEATIMMPDPLNGGQSRQWKTHLVAWSDEEIARVYPELAGKGIILPTAPGPNGQQESTGKKQIGFDNFAIGLRPVHGHTEWNVDIQTNINHLHHIVPVKDQIGAIRSIADRFVEGMRTGNMERGIIKGIFANLDEDEDYDPETDTTGMVLKDFVAQGGRLTESPYLMQKMADKFLETLVKKGLKGFKFPVQGGFSMYVAHAYASPDERVRNMERGQAFVDFERETIFVNHQDYTGRDWKNNPIIGPDGKPITSVATRQGGEDQDDNNNLLASTRGGVLRVLDVRNPQTQGEYSIFNLINSVEELQQHGINVTDRYDLDAVRSRAVTQFNEKQYQHAELPKSPIPDWVITGQNTPEGVPVISDPYMRFQSYLTGLMIKKFTGTGTYMDMLAGSTAILGREPVHQVAPSDVIIDAYQKNSQTDTSLIDQAIQIVRKKYGSLAMPGEGARRYHKTSKFKMASGDPGDYVETQGHFLDESWSGVLEIAQYVETETQKISNTAAPHRRVVAQTHGSDFSWGRQLASVYNSALNETAPGGPRKGKLTKEDYIRADEATADWLMRLPKEERNKAIYESMTMAFRQGGPRENDDGTVETVDPYLSDTKIWGKRTGQITLEALRDIRALGKHKIRQNSDVIAVVSRGTWFGVENSMYRDPEDRLRGMGKDYVTPQEKQEYIEKTQRFISELLQTIPTVELSPADEKGRRTIKAGDIELGILDRSVHGSRLDNLDAAVLLGAYERKPNSGEYVFLLGEPVFTKEDEAEIDREKSERATRFPFDYAAEVREGKADLSGLTPAARKSVEYASDYIEREGYENISERDRYVANNLALFTADVMAGKETLDGLSETNAYNVEQAMIAAGRRIANPRPRPTPQEKVDDKWGERYKKVAHEYESYGDRLASTELEERAKLAANATLDIATKSARAAGMTNQELGRQSKLLADQVSKIYNLARKDPDFYSKPYIQLTFDPKTKRPIFAMTDQETPLFMQGLEISPKLSRERAEFLGNNIPLTRNGKKSPATWQLPLNPEYIIHERELAKRRKVKGTAPEYVSDVGNGGGELPPDLPAGEDFIDPDGEPDFSSMPPEPEGGWSPIDEPHGEREIMYGGATAGDERYFSHWTSREIASKLEAGEKFEPKKKTYALFGNGMYLSPYPPLNDPWLKYINGEQNVTYRLADDARVLKISSKKSLEKFLRDYVIKIDDGSPYTENDASYKLDMERLSKDYDAVEIKVPSRGSNLWGERFWQEATLDQLFVVNRDKAILVPRKKEVRRNQISYSMIALPPVAKNDNAPDDFNDNEDMMGVSSGYVPPEPPDNFDAVVDQHGNTVPLRSTVSEGPEYGPLNPLDEYLQGDDGTRLKKMIDDVDSANSSGTISSLTSGGDLQSAAYQQIANSASNLDDENRRRDERVANLSPNSYEPKPPVDIPAKGASGTGRTSPNQKTAVIGDIHGATKQLEEVVQKIKASGASRIIQLGDVLGRADKAGNGPEVYLQIMDQLDQLGVERLVGNHEMELLRGSPLDQDVVDFEQQNNNAILNRIKSDVLSGRMKGSTVVDGRLVTHAGLSGTTYKKLSDEVAAKIGHAPSVDELSDYINQTFVDAVKNNNYSHWLLGYGGSTGRDYRKAGVTWADMWDGLAAGDVPPIDQIVGHTDMDSGPVQGRNIIFGDVGMNPSYSGSSSYLEIDENGNTNARPSAKYPPSQPQPKQAPQHNPKQSGPNSGGIDSYGIKWNELSPDDQGKMSQWVWSEGIPFDDQDRASMVSDTQALVRRATGRNIQLHDVGNMTNAELRAFLGQTVGSALGVEGLSPIPDDVSHIFYGHGAGEGGNWHFTDPRGRDPQGAAGTSVVDYVNANTSPGERSLLAVCSDGSCTTPPISTYKSHTSPEAATPKQTAGVPYRSDDEKRWNELRRKKVDTELTPEEQKEYDDNPNYEIYARDADVRNRAANNPEMFNAVQEGFKLYDPIRQETERKLSRIEKETFSPDPLDDPVEDKDSIDKDRKQFDFDQTKAKANVIAEEIDNIDRVLNNPEWRRNLTSEQEAQLQSRRKFLTTKMEDMGISRMKDYKRGEELPPMDAGYEVFANEDEAHRGTLVGRQTKSGWVLSGDRTPKGQPVVVVKPQMTATSKEAIDAENQSKRRGKTTQQTSHQPKGVSDVGNQSPPTENPNPLPKNAEPSQEELHGAPEAKDVDTSVLRHAPKEAHRKIIDLTHQGKNWILNAPTGYGKTAALIGGFAQTIADKGAGLGVYVTPFKLLSEQMRNELEKAGYGGIFLPGYPGKNASPEDQAAYEKAQDDFYSALGVATYHDAEGNERWAIGEDGPSFTGAGLVKFDENGKAYWDGNQSLGIVMSMEKYVNTNTRLGRTLQWLNQHGLIRFTGIDEVHETSNTSRHAGRYMPDALAKQASGGVVGAVSGSLTPEGQAVLEEVYNATGVRVDELRSASERRVNWSAKASTRDTAPQDIADALNGDAPALVFPETIDLMKKTQAELEQRGNHGSFLFHADANNPLTPEEKAVAERKLLSSGPDSGMRRGDVGIVSGAGGTGINRPEVEQVVVNNARTMEELAQKAGRLRAPLNEEKDENGNVIQEWQPNRNVTILADPAQYRRWAKGTMHSADKLSRMEIWAEGFEYLQARHKAKAYDRNWKIAGQQMQNDLAEFLQSKHIDRGLSSTMKDILVEVGLINPIREDAYVVNPQGLNREQITELLDRSTSRSRVRLDGTTGPDGKPNYAAIPIPERIREDATLLRRHYNAEAKLYEQTLNGSISKQDAGDFIERSVRTYNREGLQGFENFVNRTIPKELSDRYIKAVEAAAKEFEASADKTKSMSQAQADYAKKVGEARKLISGNEDAAKMAVQGLSSLAAGYAQAGRLPVATMLARTAVDEEEDLAAGTPGGGTPNESRNYGRSGGSDKEGRKERIRNSANALLYGLYNFRRWNEFTFGEVAQRALQGGAPDFYLPTAYGAGNPVPYEQSLSSFESKYQAGQEFMARGAMQEVGAILELPYAISRGKYAQNISRLSSIGSMALGIGALGLEVGATFSMMGAPEIGMPIAAAGMTAGGMAFVVGAVAEYYNKSTGKTGRDAITLDNLVRRAAMFQTVAGTLGIGAAMAGPSKITAQQQKKLKDEFDRLKNEEAPWYNLIFYGGQSPLEAQYEEASQKLVQKLGGKTEDYNPYFVKLNQMFGRTPNTDDLVKFFEHGKKLGYSKEEYFNEFGQLGAQLGLRPGSPEYKNLMDKLSKMDSQQLFDYQNQVSMQAQFGSQYAQYVGGYSEAMDIERRYPTENPYGVQVYTQALAALQAIGYDTNTTVKSTLERTETPVEAGAAPLLKVNPEKNKAPNKKRVPILDDGEKLVNSETGEEVSRDSVEYVEGRIFLKAEAEPGGEKGEIVPTTTVADRREDRASTDVPYKVHNVSLAEEMKRQSKAYTPQVAQMVWGMSTSLASRGMDEQTYRKFTDAAGSYFSKLGYTDWQRNMTSAIAAGDMGAMSYAYYNDPNLLRNMGYKDANAGHWLDRSGNPIVETSGSDWVKMLNAQGSQGILQSAQPYAGLNEQNVWSTVFQGRVTNSGLQNAFMSGGLRGAGWYMFDRQYAIQQQQFSIQEQQFELQKSFTREMWGYEDQQRAMEHTSRLADFASQEKRLNLQYQYGQQEEQISYARMMLGQQQNKWMAGFDYQTGLMQRKWAREDWQYQDTTRQLQFGWNMEDMDEAIRFSSGRERRHLVKQKERAVTSQNLEEEQIGKSHSRQEQLWAREDERFKKQQDYAEQLMALDRQQFQLNHKQKEELFALEMADLKRHMEEYARQYELQTKMIEAQRRYQEKQWEFQERELQLQKEAMQLQHEYEALVRKANEVTQDLAGEWKQIAQYDPAKLMKPLLTMFESLGALDTNTIKAIADLFAKMSAFGSSGVTGTTTTGGGKAGSGNSGIDREYTDTALATRGL